MMPSRGGIPSRLQVLSMTTRWRLAVAGVIAAAVAGAGLSGCAQPALAERFAGAGISAEIVPEPPREITLAVVGDVMLDRTVGERIRSAGASNLLRRVRSRLRSADLAFANLECPLSSEGPHEPKECCFRADPATVKVLTDGGFDVVSLANNHTLNAGRVGVLSTIKALRRANIQYCGLASERGRASDSVFVQAHGLKVGFLAFSDLDEFGAYSRVGHDLEAHAQRLREAKQDCDLLLVSYHWGEEDRREPTKRQREIAHVAVDSGADVVLGHHPHVLEGVELYRGVVILYSMGNFVFDQRAGERMASALFRLRYREHEGWEVRALPIEIPWPSLRPQAATGKRRDEILARLRRLSAELGTTMSSDKGEGVVRTAPVGPVGAASAASGRQALGGGRG
jgi:poly-gamma-glutamate synthesis protein (capsule biosynthesis protein)